MIKPPVVRQGRLARAGRALMVAVLLLLAVSLTSETAASAHEGHNCPGRTSSGFSCSADVVRNTLYIFTFYNGSTRSSEEISAGNLNWSFRVCDRRGGDNIVPTIQVSGGGTVRAGDSGGCAQRTFSARSISRFRVAMTNAGGSLTHATKWIATGDVPPDPGPW